MSVNTVSITNQTECDYFSKKILASLDQECEDFHQYAKELHQQIQCNPELSPAIKTNLLVAFKRKLQRLCEQYS